MKRTTYRFFALVIPIVAMFFTGLDSRGGAVPAFSIEKLVAQSDLIVVARIIKVSRIADGQITIHGQIFPADMMEAAAEVEETLKGARQDSTVAIRFAVPISPGGSVGYGRLFSQQVRLLFLKNFPSGGYEPADPYYPSLPATRNRDASLKREIDVNEPKLEELEAKIVSIEYQTISSADENADTRLAAIWILTGAADPCLPIALHNAFESSDQDIRLTAAAALLKLNDTQVLGAPFGRPISCQSIPTCGSTLHRLFAMAFAVKELFRTLLPCSKAKTRRCAVQ